VCGGLNYNLPYRDVNLLLFYYNELTILCSLFIAFSVQCHHNIDIDDRFETSP